jgi:hypothetical protein
MSTSNCPSCGASATGAYCADCGAAIAATCRGCKEPLPAGARFCTHCGVAVGGESAAAPAPAGARGLLPWAVAVVAVLALTAFVVVPRMRAGAEPEPAVMAADAPFARTGGDASQVDLSSMTPREAADRLFNRVMEGMAAGDTAEARAFIPMAVQAYALVEDNDADLHYHLATLHLANDDPAAARISADAILAADPNHLFGLHSAARARVDQGDAAAARPYYQRFLDAYTVEVARDLPEYRDHARIIPVMRAEAEQALAGG